ncbi:Glycoside hydrolase, end-alpha-1,4-polygalactosaminidase [Paraburkholderia dioscoreae]|uniref:Glycoside hydrolase, end-alpha-1,4-polygalactosaminidase n=2 Tax=Burkholderiaceae TaxID=119060 RepID=A0A5Q4ZAQ6_9BURK|nr:Glycoside hydrolase, end-alpha-1,4-polygalactosaminidase [Paraburkholderia dioscoreae]
MPQYDFGPLQRAARARLAFNVQCAGRLARRWIGAAVAIAATGSMAACGGGSGGSGANSANVSSSSTSSNSNNSANSTGSANPATNANSNANTNTQPMSPTPAISAARALPAQPVWAAYYGLGSALDIAQAAATFKLIVIDADPGNGTPAFSAAQIAALKADGAKVLSYLNFGACEKSRTYWNTVPSGFVSCGANTSAQISKYQGFQEYWMNPANADYQNLLVNYVAARLAATGVDGFMLDNFEIVGHGAGSSTAPCDAACAQGGLDLVKQLRDRFPDLVLVPNAAPVQAIGGTTGGVSFPWLIDGVIAEQVFLPSTSTSVVQQLKSWQSTEQNLGRNGFFAGSLDYVSSCTASSTAQTAWTAAQQAGFSPSISIASLDSICWWSFLPVGS